MKSYLAAADTSREIFSLSLSSPAEFPKHKTLESPHFACLVVWDSRAAPLSEVSALLQKLIDQGASYLLFWGPGCDRLHGVADEIVSHPDADLGLPVDATIMTTDHAGEPLNDAIWDFLNISSPADSLAVSTRAGLAVIIGSSEWATAVEHALSNN